MLKKLFKTEKKTIATEIAPYSLVSKIYSDLMQEVNYKRWARYLYHIVQDKFKPHTDILELASGSCELSAKFQHKNENIICTDISKEMLLQSSYQKKVVCDMTSLPFNKQFDLIFSTFDSINYILAQKKLLTLFKEVFRCLKPDGVFTFDVSLEKNSYIHQKNSRKSGKTKYYSYKRKSIYDEKTRIHHNIFMIKDNSGNVFTETHKQKIYGFNTYFNLLDRAGFYVVNCYKTFTLKEGNADTDRIQFIVKRK